jgi:hypothetical protein
MKVWKRWLVTVVSPALTFAILAAGCGRTQAPTGRDEGAGAPPIPNTATASAALRRTDFRLNPPVVEDLTVRRGSGGSVSLEVKFADDPRLANEVTITQDETPIRLHDDGRDGDKTAGDRLFVGRASADFDALASAERKALEAIREKRRNPRLFEFRGREIVRTRTIDEALISSLIGKDVIKLVTVDGVTVDEKKSLLVTDLSVIEDPARTFNPCTGTGTPGGKWTFAYLMEQMANTPKTGINASDFVQLWLQHWLSSQSVNSFSVPARASIQNILAAWPKLADGRLDLTKAPVRLLAIVNRIDLATNLAYGHGNAGEGRFVFGLVGPGCSAPSFLIILEYGVPLHTCMEIKSWAQQWVNLGTLPFGPSYNAALEAITEQFAKADADPSKPNGSALNQLRTNEIFLAGPWELREFRIASDDIDVGQLREVAVKQTPERAVYNGTIGAPQQAKLATWINNNEVDVLADRHVVPAILPFPDLLPFMGGSAPNNISDFWNAAGISNPEARFHFSLNTCNACHGRETNTGFTHVGNAPFGAPPPLSGFLIGDGVGGPLIVTDPMQPAVTHNFFDLERRAGVLNDFATTPCFGFIKFQPILMTH